MATNSSSSTENKKLEGKLDALVNLVTQLAMNQKYIPVARAMVYVLLQITIQIYVLLCSNLASMSNLKLMLQIFIIDPLSSKTNNSKIIMIFQATDTIQVGEFVQI